MKKSINIWQRLLAFAMVCTMLVGYVPVFAAAEGDPAYEEITGFTATLVCTTTAEETKEIRNTDEPVLDAEGNPALDSEGNPVYKTEEVVVFKKVRDAFSVEGAPEGAVIEWSENNVLISSNGRYLKASMKAPETVTQLETVTKQEVIWKASVLAWNDIQACTAITAPAIEYGEGCSLDSVAWSITDANGDTRTAGEEAHMSMGILVATATIGEQTFTRTAKVTYAAAEYQFSPEAGWFAEMPEVKVTAITANPKEEIAPVKVGDAAYEWVVNEEVPGSYVATIPVAENETTKTIVVDKISRVYNVDNAELSISKIYAIRYDDKTEVVFEYTTGASGATALINDQEVTLEPGENKAYQVFLTGAVENIQVKMTNILGREATASCVSIPYPTITATSPIIGYVNGVAYVGRNANYISFAMNNAYGDVTWKVESELEVSNYTIEGNEIKIYVSPDAPFEVPVGASATDSRGRSAYNGGYAKVAVDMVAPEVTVTGLQTVEETHMPAEQTYTIKATDDVVLSTVSARYYLHNDNEGTEIALVNGEGSFTQKDGQHLKKIVVTALDVSGNETSVTWETNVVVDTTAPVLSASISAYAKDADGNYTIPANVEAIYVVNDEPYLKFSTVDVESNDASLKVDGSIKVQIAFFADDANIADGNWLDGVEYVTQIVEENNVEKFAISGITIKDKAGNVPAAPLAITIGGDESGTKLPLDLVSGVYSGSVWVDRRSPEDNVTDDGEAPVVTLKIASENHVENGLPIFKAGTASFSLAVKDDSGLVSTVATSVTGDGVSTAGTIELDAAGNGIVNVAVAEGKKNQECQLRVQVYDVAGNYYIYILNFGVDSIAPEMNDPVISPVAGDTFAYEGDGNYHKQDVIITFEMSDQIPAEGYAKFTIHNDNTLADESKTVSLQINELVNGCYVASGSMTLTNGQRLTNIELTATDALGNTSTIHHKVSEIVDRDVPEIEIEVVSSDDYVEWKNGVHSYEEATSVKIKVTDENYLEAAVSYKLNGQAYDNVPLENGMVKSIELKEGDLLTDLKVEAKDKSLNTSDDVLDYGVAVDSKDPEVTITKTLSEGTAFIQHFEGNAYYNGSISYTVTITDSFLDLDSTSLTVNDTNIEMKPVEGNSKAVTATFDVVNGTDLTNIKIIAKDMSKHHAMSKNIVVNDCLEGENKDISFEGDSGTMIYNGPVVVVDTVQPTAVLKVDGNVKRYYSRVIDNVEHFFVEIEKPVDKTIVDELLKFNEKETVNFSLTVQDAHLSIATENIASNTNVVNNGTTGVLSQSEDRTTVTYTNSIEVKKDEIGTLVIDVTAHDMAGWPMVMKVEAAGDNSTLQPEVIDGRLSNTFVVDRRRASTETEDKAPEIVINMPAAEKKSIKNVDLYTAAFNLTITINDGQKTTENAGLKYVSYEIKDDRNVLTAFVEESYEWEKAQLSHTFKQTVGSEGIETDKAVLTVTAIDNMDNKIVKQVEFAVDTLAPRISASYTNNDVRNEKYFKEARTIQIEVEDLNFDPTKALLNDLKAADITWESDVQNGIYKTSYAYTTEADHTFSMEVGDLAGWSTVANKDSDTITWAEHSVAMYEFTLDWTKPRINVVYAPAAASGRDGAVSHYNQAMTAYATITEHNFSTGAEDEAGVVTNITPAGSAAFGNWSDDGDDHKSNATFQEGNNYSFTINCTDLAGNIADTYTSHTFCVDTHAPTIEITAGDLTNDELNIVQDDLTLGFTINDAQKNLSNYNVTVTKLGNDFKKTTITGSDFFTVVEQEARTTVLVNFKAIAKEKLNDGVYTVQITARDFAGNAVSLTPDLLFSLNRFGSTFMTDDEYTLKFLELGSDGNVYHQEVSDKLIIHEINPNRVYSDGSKKHEGSALTVIVNGTSTTLEEGKDYSMNISEQGSEKSRWYVYTYEIDPDTFADEGKVVDGRYSILISGEDEAGNKNTNESNVSGKLQKDEAGEYNGKIEFVLDTSAPIITTTGIESGKNYDAEAQKLQIFLSDSTPTSITVYLNGSPVALSELLAEMDEAAQWLVYDEESNSYILNVPELNTLFSGQEIRIVVVDEAGNETELFINDFSVSTNLFVRLLNSTWFIVSVIVLAILLIVLFLLKKRKKVAV